MTDIQYSSHLLGNQVQTRPNATWGLSIAAAGLALLIGLSAADIHKPNAAGADQTRTLQQDGRGKWGGYTQ